MEPVKERDHYFDNLKFALIILVVVGHILEPTINSQYGARFIFMLIYSFHMPLFSFVSGYFSKNYKITNLTSRVIVPYAVFQVLYFLFDHYFLGGINNKFTFFTPYWIMWYLLALLVWELLLPLFKFKYSVFVSITIAVLAGYDNVGYYLTLSRIIYFFPFFLIGYKFNKEKFFGIVPKGYQKALSAAGMLSLGIILYYFLNKIETRFFYGSYPYSELNLNGWYAGFYRILLYSYTFLISFFFLHLVPAAKNYFSLFGRRTLNVYLFHGFVVKLLLILGIYRYLGGGLGTAVLIILGAVIAYVLSLKLFNNIMKLLSLLRIEKLYKA